MALTGTLGAHLLVSVPGDAFGNVLPMAAAASWGRLRRDVHARHGWMPVLSGGACGYRTLAQQRRIFLERYQRGTGGLALHHLATLSWGNGGRKTYDGATWYRLPGKATAATPGTSNHGTEAGAVDVAGISGSPRFRAARYLEFAGVAAEHGWTNTEGRSIGEPWHWVHNGTDRHINDRAPSPVVARPPAPVTPEPDPQDPLMRLIQHKDRGILLVGPGYAHHVNEEELHVAVRLYGDPEVFLPNEAGAREFDLARALHVNRSE